MGEDRQELTCPGQVMSWQPSSKKQLAYGMTQRRALAVAEEPTPRQVSQAASLPERHLVIAARNRMLTAVGLSEQLASC